MPFLGIPTSKADLGHAGLVKGAAGGILEAYGALGGGAAATQAGHNITNPAVNLYGQLNPMSISMPPASISKNTPGLAFPSSTPSGDTSAGTSGAVADPYAVYGGQSNFDALRAQLGSALGGVRSSGGEAFSNAGLTLRGIAEGAINSLRQGQTSINTSRTNNELNRMSGINSILEYVRKGLQQGGSRLANANATESSATGALSRAYGLEGSNRSRGVNTQAALASNALDANQSNLDLQRGQSGTDLNRSKDSLVSQIGSDVRGKLQALDEQAIGLSLPDRIAVDQEKQAIVDEGMQKLTEVQDWYNQQLPSISAISPDQIRSSANQLRLAGTALSNPFAVDPISQSQVANPSIDQLPLFTRFRKAE